VQGECFIQNNQVSLFEQVQLLRERQRRFLNFSGDMLTKKVTRRFEPSLAGRTLGGCYWRQCMTWPAEGKGKTRLWLDCREGSKK
jgi:hypothetical protein